MREHTGLVLSGGGARGAYEVGVVRAIVEVLGRREGPAPFSVFTGTSVGALNGTWLAAHADRPDMAIDGLHDHWSRLRLDEHLRLQPAREVMKMAGKDAWSLLDPRALHVLMTEGMPWDRLYRNVDAGIVRALCVACLEVATGRTVLFADLSAPEVWRPSRDPAQVAVRTRITRAHVLASTALPFLFPAVRIGDQWHVDGGLRFNTPIAPALRMGVDRIAVISLLYEGARSIGATAPSYPGPVFLAGKTLNALLLDPMANDIAILERFNRLYDVLNRVLTPTERARVAEALVAERGTAYRRLHTLVFRPSKDIGAIATRRARSLRSRNPLTWLLAKALRSRQSNDSDLMSFLLFDRSFAEELIELGYRDGLGRAEEIRSFFA